MSALRAGFGLLAGLAGALVFGCAPARAETSPEGDILGTLQTHVVAGDETLLQLARRYDLGFVELRAANPGIDPWIPRPGTHLVLPTAHILPDAPREGIVIDLAAMRLFYFPGAEAPPVTFPLGIGREGWGTPLGRTRVVRKQKDPTWYPPASIREEKPHLPAAVPPGPANPLGRYALYLGWDGYLLHGTNKPNGVGRRISHGCIRLYPENIEWLFAKAAVGTPVTIVYQEIKLGWQGGALYIEVHPTPRQADQIEARGTFDPVSAPDIRSMLAEATKGKPVAIDKPLVARALAERRGVPVRISD